MIKTVLRTAALLGASAAISTAHAQQIWQQHEFFQNSESRTAYFYSGGNVSGASKLELIDKKLPVESSSFVSAPNSLRLAWQSVPNGSWDVEIRLPNWPNRYIDFAGDTLYLWVFSPSGIYAKDLPRLCLRDTANNFSAPLSLGDFAHDIPAAKWQRAAIPLANFRSASMHALQPERAAAIVLLQGATDGAKHTLLLDEIRIEKAAVQTAPAPPAPENLQAKGYERHVQLTWQTTANDNIAQYVIYRSLNGGPFQQVGVQRPSFHRTMDFVNEPHATAIYKVSARASSLRESPASNEASASTHPMTDDDLLTMVQEASFQYYWDGAEPNRGMALESIPGDPDLVAVGASGFGTIALIVGAERGFAPRDQIVDRMLCITNYLARADRFHGAWPHFLSGRTGYLAPNFGLYDDGADLVETSFLMEGLLSARGYFTRDTLKETQLRDEITTLWRGVEWDWFNATPKHDALYWHWSPNFGFHTANRVNGWERNAHALSSRHRLAHPSHPCKPLLLRLGRRRKSRPQIRRSRSGLRPQARSRRPRRQRRPTLLHPLLLHGIRSPRRARQIHQLLRQQSQRLSHPSALRHRQPASLCRLR